MAAPVDVTIHTEFITLGQLLKLAGILGSGGDVRSYLSEGGVLVNGEEDNRRGRKIRAQDVVSLPDGTLLRVVS